MKYPSIPTFNDFAAGKSGKIKFIGRPKLKGLQVSITKTNESISFNSKNGALNSDVPIDFSTYHLDFLFEGVVGIGLANSATVYMHWVDNKLIIFDFVVDGEFTNITKIDPSQNIYDIHYFNLKEIEIDFDDMKLSESRLKQCVLDLKSPELIEDVVASHKGIIFTSILDQKIKFKY